MTHRAPAVIIALAILVIFLPALAVPYGLTDDYLYLAQAERLGLSSPYAESTIHAAAAEGRPFWGLLVDSVFSAAGTIDNLRFVRIITVLGIVALALLLYWALVRSSIARTPAALIALLVCTLPSFQLYASWTIAFSLAWATVLAGCASLLVVAAVDAPRRVQLYGIAGGTALLLVALMIYQPAAMFFWVFLAVALVGSVADSKRTVRLAQMHFAVAALALVLAYLGYRLGVWLIGADPSASRGALTHDVAGKAEWFARWALYGALNLFDVTWSAWLAALVAAVAAGGILLWLLRRATPPLLFIALAAILIPLTVLPNLVVEETYNFQVARTQVSLQALIALYFALGALALWLTLREWLEGRVSRRALLACERGATALAVAFVAAAAVIASRNVDTLIAEPQQRELRVLRGQVAVMPASVQNVAFVLSGPAERVPGSPLSDEFGFPSTSPWYPAEPLVLLLLRERMGEATPRPVVNVLPWYTTSTPEGASVVNLNGLLGSR